MCNTEQYQELKADLVSLRGEVEHLKTEVATLRTWTEGWPQERESAAMAKLMRAEIDLYRKAAELALTALADRIQAEIGELKGGMTEGAEAAIASLAEEVRGWSTRMETRADVETKVTLVMQLHEKALEGHRAILERVEKLHAAQVQGSTFDEGIERLVETYRDLWAQQKAGVDAERERQHRHDEEEKRSRMARERRKVAREARMYKFFNGVSLPLLLTAVGTTVSNMLNRASVLGTQGMVGISAVAILVSLAIAAYWMVLRPPPPDEHDVDERATDTAPPDPPAPPGDTQAAGG